MSDQSVKSFFFSLWIQLKKKSSDVLFLFFYAKNLLTWPENFSKCFKYIADYKNQVIFDIPDVEIIYGDALLLCFVLFLQC
jgi:hypothetical protein